MSFITWSVNTHGICRKIDAYLKEHLGGMPQALEPQLFTISIYNVVEGTGQKLQGRQKQDSRKIKTD